MSSDTDSYESVALKKSSPVSLSIERVALPAILRRGNDPLPKVTLHKLDSPDEQRVFHIFPSGEQYFGYMKGGIREGKGTSVYPDKGRYQGNFVEDKPHGWGEHFFSSGNYYRGQFWRGQMTGQGMYYSNRFSYKGLFVAGRREGRILCTYPDGEPWEAYFQNDTIRKVSLWEMGSKFFLKLLLGKGKDGMRPDYAVAILSQFLLENGYQSSAEILNSTLEMYDSKTTSSSILAKLGKGESHLLMLNVERHALGIFFVPGDGKSIDIKVYNSGLGLFEYHDRSPNGSKFKTEFVVRVPKNSIDAKIIDDFLNHKDTSSVAEVYQSILQLEGAKKIKSEGKEVWQSAQKANNCTCEWVFALLRNMLGYECYNTIRWKLFRFCLSQNIRRYGNSEDQQKLREELDRKIGKREARDLEYRKGRKDDKPDFVASHHSSNAAR